MKVNKKIATCIIIIFIIILILFVVFILNKKNNKQDGIDYNPYSQIDKNQIAYQENVTINDLIEETGMQADSNIYEIQQELDGRKVLAVKASIKYKVAFAGIMKETLPKMQEIDEIYNNNVPTENGIWIEEKSRNKVLEMFNNNAKSKYTIDNNGYLKIQDKNLQNDVDKKIESIINGDKQYIIDISSVCYIIDNVTGEILDYNFEKLDRFQTYEYFEDNGKMIIFVTENTNNLLTENEIFNSIIDLM